jgi:hypothetical protein
MGSSPFSAKTEWVTAEYSASNLELQTVESVRKTKGVWKLATGIIIC